MNQTDAHTTIGIISDTHNRLDQPTLDALAGVDHIFHAGDIGSPGILLDLGAVAPVTAVLGNCDYGDYGPGVAVRAEKAIAGVSFAMVHKPESLKGARCDVCIHGHTHVPKIERSGGSYIVCPGSPTKPRGGSVPSIAVITIVNGTVMQAQIKEIA